MISLAKDKLNTLIDVSSTQGGTPTTGDVARRCLKGEKDTDKDFLYWILTIIEHKQEITYIYNTMGAVLLIYSSSRRIDIEELKSV